MFNCPKSNIQQMRETRKKNQKYHACLKDYFAQSLVFAQQDTADFSTLAIKNNYNVTSMTFDANRLETRSSQITNSRFV